MRNLLLAGVIVSIFIPGRGDAEPAGRTATVGGLMIAGGDYSAPSHGGYEFIGSAHFVLTNPTDRAITFTATLALCADTGCVPLQIEKFATDALDSRPLTVPAHGSQPLHIRAQLGAQRALYHVRCWHQATFTSGSDRAVVAAGSLYFRAARVFPKLDSGR